MFVLNGDDRDNEPEVISDPSLIDLRTPLYDQLYGSFFI